MQASSSNGRASDSKSEGWGFKSLLACHKQAKLGLKDIMIKKIKDFLREVKLEIKKVVFPTKDELIGSTWVVIIVVLIISIFLGIVDLGLSKIVALALR